MAGRRRCALAVDVVEGRRRGGVLGARRAGEGLLVGGQLGHDDDPLPGAVLGVARGEGQPVVALVLEDLDLGRATR